MDRSEREDDTRFLQKWAEEQGDEAEGEGERFESDLTFPGGGWRGGGVEQSDVACLRRFEDEELGKEGRKYDIKEPCRGIFHYG